MAFNGTLIAIDCGNVVSGVVVIDGLKIAYGSNMDNNEVLKLLLETKKNHSELLVVIEDMKPYSVPLTQQTVDTCKFIGKLCYFCDLKRIKYEMVTRHQVKKWVFDTFPDVVMERIDKKIAKKNQVNNDGKMRKASYVYVDDRIVIAAMKVHWDIPTPPPYKKTMYGLSAHSWQSLGVASFFLASS